MYAPSLIEAVFLPFDQHQPRDAALLVFQGFMVVISVVVERFQGLSDKGL